VAATEEPTVSRITLVTTGSEAVVNQIVNQLNKLIDVVTVDDMTGDDHLERELVLVKLRLLPEKRETVGTWVQKSGGKVLSPMPECFIVEMTASEVEVSQFLRDATTYGQLLEVVRSGALGILRRDRMLHVVGA
jgi:acetolactate synthase-1/3 small subunit